MSIGKGSKQTVLSKIEAHIEIKNETNFGGITLAHTLQFCPDRYFAQPCPWFKFEVILTSKHVRITQKLKQNGT